MQSDEYRYAKVNNDQVSGATVTTTLPEDFQLNKIASRTRGLDVKLASFFRVLDTILFMSSSVN